MRRESNSRRKKRGGWGGVEKGDGKKDGKVGEGRNNKGRKKEKEER